MGSNYSGSGRRKYDILVIDSDPDTLSDVIKSFETTEITNEVTIVSSGSDALDSLNRHGEYEGTPLPDLVLLDLHLPDTSGFDILAEIKDHSELQHIPVIVLTDSDSAEDTLRTYNLHANAIVEKPDSIEASDQIAQRIEDFWLDTVRLPPKDG